MPESCHGHSGFHKPVTTMGSWLQAGGDPSKVFLGTPHCCNHSISSSPGVNTIVTSPGCKNRIKFTEGTHGFWELVMKIPESRLYQVTQQCPG